MADPDIPISNVKKNLVSLRSRVTTLEDSGAPPLAHHTTHENGGADEISVSGLSGALADAQTAAAHKTSHQDAGGDEISVTGLSGLLADDQHVLDAEVTAVAVAKSTLTEQGDVFYASAASTPAALAHGTSGQALLSGGHAANPSWGAPAPAAHSIESHTDVSRTFFVPCSPYYTGGLATTAAGSHARIGLDATTPELCRFEFMVPSDFVSFTSLMVVWSALTGGTAGNDWVCDPAASYAAANEPNSTHTDTPANITIDVTIVGRLYVTDVGFTLANLTSGDYVGVEIERQADDGADTYEQDILIYGILLTYTASQ